MGCVRARSRPKLNKMMLAGHGRIDELVTCRKLEIPCSARHRAIFAACPITLHKMLSTNHYLATEMVDM